MNRVTDKQREVYDFICTYVDTAGYPPTYREIAARFQFTEHAARCHVEALEQKGLVALARGQKARSIVPVRDAIRLLHDAAERARVLLANAGSDIATAITANQIRTALGPLEADLRGATTNPRKAAGIR